MLSSSEASRKGAGLLPGTEKESDMDTRQDSSTTSSPAARLHQGGCHCGAVRFQVRWDPAAGAGRCNCSVCTKISPVASIVKPDAFQLLAGEDSLGTYQWGPKISRRHFCKHCGVHCFGRGFLEEVGGNYVSFNVNCLDDIDPTQVKLVYWDGRHNNWEAGPRPTPWPISP
jgi:hypothetical protein